MRVTMENGVRDNQEVSVSALFARTLRRGNRVGESAKRRSVAHAISAPSWRLTVSNWRKSNIRWRSRAAPALWRAVPRASTAGSSATTSMQWGRPLRSRQNRPGSIRSSAGPVPAAERRWVALCRLWAIETWPPRSN